ncbi:MAG: hypothetical protein V8S89_06560 [Oscillospiraceae bacterium]
MLHESDYAKSGLTPDQLMRRQLYSLLAPLEQDGGVNFVGSFYALNRDSDLVQLIAASGRPLREITACKTYEDYLQMARGSLNLITHPAAEPVGPYLQEKLGQRYLYLPVAYRAAEIRQQQAQLAQTLELPVNTPQLDAAQAQAMQALDEARGVSAARRSPWITQRRCGLWRWSGCWWRQASAWNGSIVIASRHWRQRIFPGSSATHRRSPCCRRPRPECGWSPGKAGKRRWPSARRPRTLPAARIL